MAVTLTGMAAELRLGDGITPPVEPVAGILTRLLSVSEAFIDQAAPYCPSAIRDEALIRFSAYLYDMPTAATGDRYAAAWRNSGAEALTSRFVARRAVQAVGDGELAPEETGGLTVAEVRALIREELEGVLAWR